ncbi:hypothetical protein F5878DRAFT_541419 [Lentinula raphanica]|uniref:Uncharacterized protein n=1 Tax=Lentinula raphanica TaxID=153919 RepID=A0AA38P5G8_9AGAR|nr:hypothetical protein F5880DRAFT_1502541 [Lentinula raphanica]KAJ3836413.1 hypothetical protein F5878DRAFT_541419 [Lentinula raphanica]
MSYSNPLHPAVPASKQSTYNSLSASMASTSSSSGSTSRRRRVPHNISPKFRLSSRPQAPVAFDCQGYPGAGMPMREIYARGEFALVQMMDKGAERVMALAQNGLRRICLVMSWPGYEHLECVFPIDLVTPAGYITRVQLAAIVTNAYVKFIERAQNERSTSPEWQFHARGIQFTQLSLLSLTHLSEDAWKAEVAVDF